MLRARLLLTHADGRPRRRGRPSRRSPPVRLHRPWRSDTMRAAMTRHDEPRRAPPLGRRLFAEFLGTGLLVTVVVGSGIAATNLTPDDVGLQLLYNSTATALGLTVLILMVGPVSGAHLNPVVSGVDWWLGRRGGTGLPGRDLAALRGRADCRRCHRGAAGERDVRRAARRSRPRTATTGTCGSARSSRRPGWSHSSSPWRAADEVPGPRRPSARTSARRTGSRPRPASRTRRSPSAGCSPTRSRASRRHPCRLRPRPAGRRRRGPRLSCCPVSQMQGETS